MKTLMLFVAGIAFISIAHAQAKRLDSSILISTNPTGSISSAVKDSAFLNKESILPHTILDQPTSAISSQKMKLAPKAAINIKIEEDRPAAPPIIYYTPEKRDAETKQAPPHF